MDRWERLLRWEMRSEGRKEGKRVSALGDSMNDGKNQAGEIIGHTCSAMPITWKKSPARNNSTRITAQRHWAPVLSTTNHGSTLNFSFKHETMLRTGVLDGLYPTHKEPRKLCKRKAYETRVIPEAVHNALTKESYQKNVGVQHVAS